MQKIKTDLCVYGATSGGVIAAVAAARRGRAVVLVEPGRHVGGMTSGGLSLTDFGCKDSIGGLSLAFYDRVAAYYQDDDAPGSVDTAGPDHPEGRGWTHEPHVAEGIFRDWIDEYGIRVVWNSRVSAVRRDGARIGAMTLDLAPPDERGAPAGAAAEAGYLEIEAAVFIDASYEGDLMAQAGVGYTTVRESRAQYGEPLAGLCYASRAHHSHPAAFLDPYVRPGHPESGLLPLVHAAPAEIAGTEGAAAASPQSYTFRLCLVQDAGANAGNMRPVEPPAHYDPAHFELWGRRLEQLMAGESAPTPTEALYHYPPYYFPPPYFEPRVFKITPIPRGKTDVNHLNYLGGSAGYAEGDWAARARIWHAHEDHQRGLLYFLRTDERIPAAVRTEIAKWGLPLDEFTDSGGWPHQLYIRESRRMLGSYVVTQQHCESGVPCEDAIALGSHQLDSHICQLLAREGRVLYEGNFFQAVPGPYPIPYRAIVPRRDECENLLVLFCLSASHAAYSSLRMEPVLMMLGHAAAVAADLALAENCAVQAVSMGRLQQRLRDEGQLLEYAGGAG